MKTSSGSRLDADGCFEDGAFHVGGHCFPYAACGLSGLQNIPNILAAVTIATDAGVPADAIRRTLAGFRGIRHRMPEAGALARLTAGLRDLGASHLVMEVTSHALAQRRVDGTHFAVGAFTSLTHDHLELHGSFDAYGCAKARLFRELNPGLCAMMIDDPPLRPARPANPLLRRSSVARQQQAVSSLFAWNLRCFALLGPPKEWVLSGGMRSGRVPASPENSGPEEC